MSIPALVVATSNPAKVGHFAGVAATLGLQVVAAGSLGVSVDVPETGTTLEENAVLKVNAYRPLLPEAILLADDTGVEIDVLNGEPGIYVRRWRDRTNELSDDEVIAYCLERMAGVPEGQRGMKFRSVVAVSIPGQPVQTFSGELRGEIMLTASGPRHDGMPFHGLMYLPQWQVTLGEIAEVPPLERPDKKLHREIAAEAAMRWVATQLGTV